jgi:hypothetical protein
LVNFNKTGIEEFLFPERNIKEEWNTRIGSKSLPGIIPTNLSFDHEKLYRSLLEILEKTENTNDIYENDVILDCMGIKDKLPETYYTYVLTQPTEKAVQLQQQLDHIKQSNWKDRQRGMSRKQLLRSVISFNNDYDPLTDERNFTVLKEELKGTYFEEVLSMFKARIARTRISTIKPGEVVQTHVDANSKYVLRAHLPIITNDNAYSHYYDNKGNKIEINMEPGSVYILNPGVSHGAINNGSTERIHLVVGLDGQEDILPLL